MRPPTQASSGYSGHHQAPAPSSSQGQNAQSQGSESNGAEKTQGPISGKPADYENFWEAPSYLWMPKEMTERESEAIMVSSVTVPGPDRELILGQSGGATDIRSGP